MRLHLFPLPKQCTSHEFKHAPGNVRTGKDPKRRKVHSSMYANLRTNLPREVMAYTDFPFDDLQGRSQDSRRFPSHAEVRPLYL